MLDFRAGCSLSQLAEQTKGAPPGLQRLPLRPVPAILGQYGLALIRMKSKGVILGRTQGATGVMIALPDSFT